MSSDSRTSLLQQTPRLFNISLCLRSVNNLRRLRFRRVILLSAIAVARTIRRSQRPNLRSCRSTNHRPSRRRAVVRRWLSISIVWRNISKVKTFGRRYPSIIVCPMLCMDRMWLVNNISKITWSRGNSWWLENCQRQSYILRKEVEVKYPITGQLVCMYGQNINLPVCVSVTLSVNSPSLQ